jgi:hypothetical protein
MRALFEPTQFFHPAEQRVHGSRTDLKGWLFKIQPKEDAEQVMQRFISAKEYLEDLKHTEGFKNPEGVMGGVSEICKAVYSGIRQQKI